MTALTVVAPDHPRLLSVIAGACAAAGGNIVDAQIFTTTDGLALDTIFVSRAFERDEDEMRRGRRIASNIEKTLRGEVRLAEIAPQKEARDVRRGAFAIEPEVMIDNTLSRRYTVVEVSGLDRPGPAARSDRRRCRASISTSVRRISSPSARRRWIRST